MTEQELTEFLEANRARIMEASRDAMIEKIKDSMKWSLPDAINHVVRDFLTNEIAPEVGKMLAEQKDGILKAAKQSASALANALAEKMTEQAVKSLDGYRAEEVFKALLGVKSRY